MSEAAKDPSKVVGFHFFNPVHRMPLVEVVATQKTSKQTIVTALGFAKRLGKTPILVKDTCGFIVNRVLLGYINEAGRLLEETGQMDNTWIILASDASSCSLPRLLLPDFGKKFAASCSAIIRPMPVDRGRCASAATVAPAKSS